MKMIDVLIKLANDEIKDQTILEIHDPVNTLYTYTFNGKYKSFYSNTEYSRELGNYFKINDNFLNREVELIEPKPKKYQLKLYKDDDLSYVTCSSYENDFNYDLSDKNETCEFITKFTQEEIDNDKFLKFVEEHGIKEEVEDNEIDSRY